MQKNKEDQDIERMMNEKGYSHAEAMDAVKKSAKKTKGSDSETEVLGDEEEVCLPSNLLPDVSVGKEINFSLSGKVTRVTDEMVYVETNNVHVDVREPYKEKSGDVKAVALDR